MYEMTPPAVFVSDRVLRDQECMRRLTAFMKATRAPDWEVVRDEDIPAMLERPVWKRARGRAGAREDIFDPVFFFNTFRFGGEQDVIRRHIAAANPGFDVASLRDQFLGYRHFSWFNSGQPADDIEPNPEHICRPCWRLHVSPGCPHECAYCGLAGFMVVGLNMSEYLHQLDRLMDANPWQLTYLIDSASDVLVYEPELDLFSELVRFFGTKEDRYLITHTKSANVDFLRELPHCGKTIMCYSLSAKTQSTQLERVTGSTDERIEAARKCQEWGMPIRFKFKPIIPLKNWRDEAHEMIRDVFEKTQPDNLSMTLLMWMGFDDLASCIDLDLLDPAFVDAARNAAASDWEHPRLRPFPHEVRREVYEFYQREVRAIDKDVPLTLCTESLAMWKDLGTTLGVGPLDYTCGCGPCAVPGLKTLSASPWKVARHNPPMGWLSHTEPCQ
jgi:spore photoproduct lyase